MKKICLAIFILSAFTTYAQRLGQVSFPGGANLSYFSIQNDQNVLIRVSEDGKLLEFGTEVLADRGNYYAPKLQPFMGRVEYYGQDADSAYRGKVKSIGISSVTYYGAFEEAAKRGKLKSLGTLQFDYFSSFDDKSLQGKLKLFGTYPLDYYKSYENESLRGKLKSIGSMPITYYTVFDDKINAGKLKSIGTAPIAWYSMSDPVNMRGSLKSHTYRLNVSGIIFILQ